MTIIQDEDQRRMLAVKSHIDKYLQLLETTQDTIDKIPPIQLSDAEGTQAVQAVRLTKALTTLETLKNRLESLRGHLEDLETEPYPTLDITDEDLDWESQIRSMSPELMKDTLAELELESSAEWKRVDSGLRTIKEQQRASSARKDVGAPALSEKQATPFPRASLKANVAKSRKADEKVRFVISTEQHVAGVESAASGGRSRLRRYIDKPKEKEKENASYGLGQSSGSATAWQPSSPVESKPVVSTAQAEAKPKMFSHDLLGLQAKLDKALKAGR